MIMGYEERGEKTSASKNEGNVMMSGAYDVCVLGGGVSGVTAAITIKKMRPDLRVTIIEKTHEILRKLAASGNGRCNISNKNAEGFSEVNAFMTGMGVYLKCKDNGWVYPYSMKSATVVNAFKDRLHSLDIGVAFNTKVCNVKRDDGGFSITCVSDTNEKIQVGARVVCLALGGKAAPKFGTVGEGFVIAKELGLEVSPVFPILTKINLEGIGDDMAGVRHDAKISLFHTGRLLTSETGQVQFIRGGISGIAAFNLSKFIVIKDRTKSFRESMNEYDIVIDFFPDLSKREFQQRFEDIKGHIEIKNDVRGENIYRYALRGFLDEKLADHIINHLEESGMPDFKTLKYKVKGLGGWDQAQATGGGILKSEYDAKTYESKIKGLFVMGELLDAAYPCGGYNITQAITTGIVAGLGVLDIF